MYCKNCHYDLLATDAKRCPECGRAFSPDLPYSYLDRIPPKFNAYRVFGCAGFMAILLVVAFLVMGIQNSGH